MDPIQQWTRSDMDAEEMNEEGYKTQNDVSAKSQSISTRYQAVKNSIPGAVHAQCQYLSVFGAGHGSDGPGCLATPSNDQYDHA